jgi:hypothetical protein
MVGPLSKKINSRTISFVSYLLIALGCFLYGPSRLIGIEHWSDDEALCEKWTQNCIDSIIEPKKDFCTEVFRV